MGREYSEKFELLTLGHFYFVILSIMLSHTKKKKKQFFFMIFFFLHGRPLTSLDSNRSRRVVTNCYCLTSVRLFVDIASMPVLSNQKAVEQLYEYPIRQAAGWAVYCTSSSIHQSLHLFRTHHQKCAARRKQALCHELRQEDQRTEWLKRKYFDSVRQQQQAISATRVDSNNPCRFEVISNYWCG